MKRKTLKSGLVAALGTAMLAVGTTGIASANNHSDSLFDFTLGRFQTSSFSAPRLKTDKSRSYAKVTEIGVGQAHIWTIRANGASIDTGSVDLGQGESAKIYNRAYEMYGRTNIELGVHARDWRAVRVHVRGLWSPDSV
ncbi:hypothetical protein J2Z60_001548 [Lactobacillus colini]|uniref:Uncharacterized protein n=1 Tax=Lactobacillus colini TaxID=1819254 RepID=A0ABS4MG93_9LACO|nr:DUF2712 domain-containing protein [Lactobacillus colini]MBP2058369.1 hypothetical protein [Lactobacillus colini]